MSAKKAFFILGSAVFLLFIMCLGLILFVLWGGGGEPATLSVAARVSQEFLEHIHNGEIDLAHSMISENFKPSLTKDQLEVLIRQDERIFKTYQRYDVCDWGFFISDGRVIDVSGLFYYEDGVIVTQLSLHKDADAIWRIQGFRFRSDLPPEPFGLCQ